MNSTLVPCWSIATAARGSGALNLLPPCLPTPPNPKHKGKGLRVNATSMPDSAGNTDDSRSEKNTLSVVTHVPRAIGKPTVRPVIDISFGRKSIWEGGVGLFVVSGTVLVALCLVWLSGFHLRSKLRKYCAVFEFDHACGISVGTPVRIRGVNIGNVVSVNPSLRSIEAIVKVVDDRVTIPRNSSVEVNQSGLLMEPRIDITPINPIPTPTVGPLDAGCVDEGLIVCDRQKMTGQRGASLDELVGISTRIGREVEGIGVSKSYSLAERVVSVAEEALPLLRKMKTMADGVRPLVGEVHQSDLLKEVENITKSLARASDDLRRVHSSILTPENTVLIQKSIQTLVSTLKNIENISSDISGLTGDEATKMDLTLLIKSISRML